MRPRNGRTENYFDHDTNIGIIGRGETIESCFVDVARALFSLLADVDQVHLTNIITFEFEANDHESALITWLNLLLKKSAEHQLVFGDFRLIHEGNIWKATVSGEKWLNKEANSIVIKTATRTLLSIEKHNHQWEARCVMDCQS